jgi:hypothetical protein
MGISKRIGKAVAIFVLSFASCVSLFQISSCALNYKAPDILLPDSDVDTLRDIIPSCVKVVTDKGYGSGIVVGYQKVEGKYKIYVLTAKHVTDDSAVIGVIWFRGASPIQLKNATLELSDETLDQSILSYVADEPPAMVASLLDTRLEEGTHVYTLGCGNLGYPYIADARVSGYSGGDLVVCGPVIYGHSGGGCLVIIKGKLYVAGTISRLGNYNGREVWTLGLCAPVSETVKWLEIKGQHILPYLSR